ncbi:MAG TPA: hypothetical protein VGE16_08820 [Albitalea sp.]
MNLRQKLSDAVERAISAVSRFLAPAMPWLFLGLRRALIATLVAVLVAALFFVVPQSREVLHGLGEPPLKSLQDFDDATSRLINFWAYLFYVLTAVALGLATWYAARLLATVEAQAATPSALAEGAGAARLQHATTWLPRGLGVFVLGAAIGALLYASYTPRLSQMEALALVALAVGGPLLVAAGVLGRRRAALWLGAAASFAAGVLLVMLTHKWRISLASILCSALPAALLWFLVRRRGALARRGWSQAGRQAHDQRGFGEALVSLFSIVAGSVALLMLLALLPTAPVRIFGSAAAVLLFLVGSVLFLAGAQILVRRAAHGVPGLTTAAIVVFAAGVAAIGDESLGEESLDSQASSAAPAAPAVPGSPPSPAPPRSLYVNAHGGGLRAAAFTAQTLARADDASCGRFGEQVAAFSGVSGGSLGIATYLVAREEHVRRNGWSGCTPGAPAATTPLTDIVVRALVQDHLSPTVARMLAVDAPHLPWSPARGQALLDSWQSALVDSLEQARTSASDRQPAAYAQRLGALSGGLTPPALVYFNATDADSGHIVWFSNRGGGQVRSHFPADPVAAPDISIGQAVLHSARFPIVSPAGGFGMQRLVDGGYADNSGTTTLLRVLLDDKPHGSAVPKLINIDGNPPSESECVRSAGKPPILTAVRALLQARSAHASLAVQHFRQAIGGSSVDVVLDLEKTLTDPAQGEHCEQLRRAHQAPLGWYVSYTAAKTMAASVDHGALQICATLGEACALPSPALIRRP